MTQEEESFVSIPPHPLGIKPSGNSYTATKNASHGAGFLQKLPDELLAIVLEHFDSYELRMLGCTCRFLYAFCRFDDFWKALFIESPQSKSGKFSWRGTWRSTLLGLSEQQISQVRCDSVYSDVLYRPFLCANTPLTAYATNIPKRNTIPRLENLSASEFDSWSSKPFILTEPVRSWPVFKSWTLDTLLKEYRDIRFRAESVDWTLETYIDYMHDNSDESPLYLFDRSFASKMDLSTEGPPDLQAYWIPECFGEDLFAVLGSKRPDDKWLIVGPAGSGSTYHKDPNATSAWNAVIRGSKYWIMFPSGPSIPPPPGVYVSEDQSEVTSPLSIAEWLLGFHEEARNTQGCVEGICHEGEVLHVPSSWWHLVVNLDSSIAITQNFVPRSHLPGVLAFLKNDIADQVSGFRDDVTDPYGLFVERMQIEHPDLLEQALAELDGEPHRKKRKWAAAVENRVKHSGGFSFGFGSDSDEEVP